MSNPYQQLADLLTDLEAELKTLGYWANEPPPKEQLQSSMPFCFDRLPFEHWLQFVLIPKSQELIKQRSNLPAKADIYPAAEEVFNRRDENTKELLNLIHAFDELSRRLI